MNYVKEHYSPIFTEFSEQIFTQIGRDEIDNILKVYSASELSDDKKNLITRYLLAKRNMLKQIYLEKET